MGGEAEVFRLHPVVNGPARTAAFKTSMNSLLLFQSFQGEVAFGVGDLFPGLGACLLEKVLLWQSAANLEGQDLGSLPGRCFL